MPYAWLPGVGAVLTELWWTCFKHQAQIYHM